MDILSKIGFDLPVFLFNIINFLIVGLVLKKFFFSKIVYTLETRKKMIEDGLQSARQAEEALANAKQNSDKLIEQAKKDADGIIEDAQQQAKAEGEKILQEFQSQAEDQISKAQKQIAIEEQQMLQKVQTAAADLVVKATRKVAGSDVAKPNVEKIIQSLELA